jgi:putative sigma-54 modulation protein
MRPRVDFVIRDAQDGMAEALRAYAVRRLSFALRRFEHGVRHVTVRLVDLNGPRRGVDSRCSIAVELVGGRPIFVDATTAWPFASITLAASRLSEALRREFGRATAHRAAGASRHTR